MIGKNAFIVLPQLKRALQCLKKLFTSGHQCAFRLRCFCRIQTHYSAHFQEAV
jgi:hypothetical protein